MPRVLAVFTGFWPTVGWGQQRHCAVKHANQTDAGLVYRFPSPSLEKGERECRRTSGERVGRQPRCTANPAMSLSALVRWR